MMDLYRSAESQQRVQDWCRRRLSEWAAPHESLFVETHLGPIHVLRAGEGPSSFVYLPGTNFNAATSLAFIGSLSATGEVWVADLPGQPGLSTPQRPPRGYAVGPSWLSETLEALQLFGRKTIVVGHSRGAAEALTATRAEADAIVLLNPAGLARVTITGALLRSTMPWMLRPTAERSRGLLRLMSAPGYEPSPEHVEWLTMVARDTRTTGAPSPVPDAWTDRWKRGSALVLCGEHDVFFPTGKVSPAARERLGAQVKEIAGVGHLSVEEAPDRVTSHIAEFVEASL